MPTAADPAFCLNKDQGNVMTFKLKGNMAAGPWCVKQSDFILNFSKAVNSESIYFKREHMYLS